ncbi:MAG: ABC transporter substrate-binding protein [Opitutaceae bacterium]
MNTTIRRSLLALAALAAAGALSAADLKKVTIAHVGVSCEAPVFIAKEKGFFAEEGLDAELLKGDWSFIKESLAFGRIDAAQGLVMTYLKPIEQGLDAKFTAGVHRGCIHILADKNSSIATAADLKGKRIGVPAIGSSPWIFAARVVGQLGADIKKDVEWKPFPAAELKLALAKGEVDAIAVADPIGELLLTEGNVKSIVNQLTDAPFKDEYCCVVVVSGKLAKNDPDTAARITRAILKASLWVEKNPQSAAEISFNAKHISANIELNSRVLTKLDYLPSVEGGRLAAATAAKALQEAGIIEKTTDLAALVDRTFIRLPGLDDKWVKSLDVAQADTVTHEQILARKLRIGSWEVAVRTAKSCCSGDVQTVPTVAANDTLLDGAAASSRSAN